MQALYWDPGLKSTLDKTTFTNDTQNGSLQNHPISNISTLVQHRQIDQVTVYTTFASLAQRLFECSSTHDLIREYKCPCRPLIVFLKRNDGLSELLHRVLVYLNSQFAHSPTCSVVLSDDSYDLACNIQHGAVEVCGSNLTSDELDRIVHKATKLTGLLGSRSSELRAVLGMTNHDEDYGFNSMTRFIFLNDEFQNGLGASGVFDKLLRFGNYALADLFSREQIVMVDKQVMQWDFYAHELNYDELLLAAVLMFQRVFKARANELGPHELSESELITFVFVVREAYHANNPYHNFRHAIDVLQATFYFLKCLGALEKNSTIKAADVLCTLVVAIGHDVGHPGVTNAFLVSCNAPIAKVYNDKSVLESFHSACFLQILRQHWPSLVDSKQHCSLMVNAVLATDMAMHFEYMNQISRIESDSGTVLEQDFNLTCCILIKCADISNVARKLDISTKWGQVLVKEFAEVANLEVEFGLKQNQKPPPPPPSSSSSSSSGDKKGDNNNNNEDNVQTLAKGQLFFINTYARPLFSQVARVFPQLEFAINMIDSNADNWKRVCEC